MITSFYEGSFFNGGFFSISMGGGGIDPPSIFKPTGLVDRKKVNPDVEARVEQSREIHAEVAGQLARELHEEDEERPPIIEMSLADIDREIGVLLRKVQRTQDEEVLLLILMAVA